MSETFTVAGRSPVDTAEGRVVAPGEAVTLDPDQPHNRRLIEGGALVAITMPDPPQEPTLTELRKRASELEITGRTSMDRQELTDAISEAEAADGDTSEEE